MNMKRTILIKRVAVAACVGVFAFALPSFADDEEEDAAQAEETEEASSEDGAAEGEAVPAPPKDDKFFYPLVRCDEVLHATVEVFKPGADSWTVANEKKYYPLGSAFRVTPTAEGGPSKVSIAFGTGSRVLVTNSAEFATRPIAIGEAARVVELRSGMIEVSLPRVLKDGLFSVAAPYFTCYNLAGDSQFEYAKLDDGDEALVRVVTGTLALKGSHYEIGKMRAANRVRVRTTKDELFTSIRGESGDCLVKLDQGLIAQKDYETGETKELEKFLDFQLSPLCAIKIHRTSSPIGGRRIVSIMTFAPNGEMKNRCAFAEKRSNVNSGELVVTTTAIKEADRKASESEAEETESVDVEATEGGGSEEGGKTEEGGDSEAASDDSEEV